MADPTTAQAPLAAGGDGGQAFDSESAAPPSALPGLGDEEYEEIANKVRALREDYRDYVLVRSPMAEGFFFFLVFFGLVNCRALAPCGRLEVAWEPGTAFLARA